MHDFDEQANVAAPAERVLISDEARNDLEKVGRVTRAVLLRTLRDELLAPSRQFKIKKLSSPSDSQPPRFVVPIGKFRVVFRPLQPEEIGQPGVTGRVVERIVRADELDSLHRYAEEVQQDLVGTA